MLADGGDQMIPRIVLRKGLKELHTALLLRPIDHDYTAEDCGPRGRWDGVAARQGIVSVTASDACTPDASTSSAKAVETEAPSEHIQCGGYARNGLASGDLDCSLVSESIRIRTQRLRIPPQSNGVCIFSRIEQLNRVLHRLPVGVVLT